MWLPFRVLTLKEILEHICMFGLEADASRCKLRERHHTVLFDCVLISLTCEFGVKRGHVLLALRREVVRDS